MEDLYAKGQAMLQQGQHVSIFLCQGGKHSNERIRDERQGPRYLFPAPSIEIRQGANPDRSAEGGGVPEQQDTAKDKLHINNSLEGSL